MAARAVPAAGPWGNAIEVPGLAALNAGGRAETMSVSCGSAGTCVAGGSYEDRRGDLQGFVVSQQAGAWGRAIEVPGLAALNAGGSAEVLSVSCGSAGTCAAGGYYYDRRDRQQGFVTIAQNGRWGRAIAVPGLAALNAGGFAEVLSVSCGPAGTCAAGGYYYDRRGQQGFVTRERTGTWGQAIGVPGLKTLNAGFDGLEPFAEVSSLSCGSAGDCAAGGFYEDRKGHGQAFVVAERNGSWGRAINPPGLAALNKGRAGTTSVSCVSAGNCAAGGGYTDRRGNGQGFVVAERNGSWGPAIEVPGLASLATQGGKVYSVSCASAGNCAAGGGYTDRRGNGQGFVVAEQNGNWGSAITVPGLAALNAGGSARIWSLSCGSAGNCAASGNYLDRQGDQQGFVVSEGNGSWGRAMEVPGLASLNAGFAEASSLSCGPAGSCVAVGYYQDRHRKVQGFVVSQTP